MIGHLLAATVLSVVPVWLASEGDTDLKVSAMSQEFSQCAGIYEFMSEILRETGKAATAASVRETANGAEVTAATILILGGTPKDIAFKLAEGRRESEMQRAMSRMELGEVDETQRLQRECIDVYLPVQDRVTKALRAYIERGVTDPELFAQMMYDALLQGTGSPEDGTSAAE